MSRAPTITLEQVTKVADEMKSHGEVPTARSIRAVLGTGSMATVLKLFQLWQATNFDEIIDINQSIEPSLLRAIGDSIISKARDMTSEASKKVTELRAEVDEMIFENESQTEEIKRCEEVIEKKSSEWAALNDNYGELLGRAHQLESELARVVTDVSIERHATEMARIELAKAGVRLETMAKIELELEKSRAELALARENASQLHEASAVATAMLESEVSQRKKAEVYSGPRISDSELRW